MVNYVKLHSTSVTTLNQVNLTLHDTECPYWDQVLNNTNSISFSTDPIDLLFLGDLPEEFDINHFLKCT